MADPATKLDLAAKRVLVTGGGGFLGRHLLEKLRQRGCTQLYSGRAERNAISPAPTQSGNSFKNSSLK